MQNKRKHTTNDENLKDHNKTSTWQSASLLPGERQQGTRLGPITAKQYFFTNTAWRYPSLPWPDCQCKCKRQVETRNQQLAYCSTTHTHRAHNPQYLENQQFTLVTRLMAPTVVPLPILTPPRRTTLPPMKTSSSITIRCPWHAPLAPFLLVGSVVMLVV